MISFTNIVLRNRCYRWCISPKFFSVSSEDIEKIKKYKEKVKLEKEISGSTKTYNMFKEEFSRYRRGQFSVPEPKIPKYAEFVIIGGGIMGSSIAYAMKQRAPDSFDVMVIERDPKVI